MTSPRDDAASTAKVCADLADLSRRLRNFEHVDPSEIEALKTHVADLTAPAAPSKTADR
jgi:hypothetical protein